MDGWVEEQTFPLVAVKLALLLLSVYVDIFTLSMPSVHIIIQLNTKNAVLARK
jgi:hypothetical protein